MIKIKVHADFGREGIPLSKLSIAYDEKAGYVLPRQVDEALGDSWNDSLKLNPSLTNGFPFNYRGISGNNERGWLIDAGPAEFKDYNEARNLLDMEETGIVPKGRKGPSEYGLNKADLAYLRKEIHTMGSHPAILIEGGKYLLMGRKGKTVTEAGAQKISFVGSGGFELGKDTYEEDGLIKAKSVSDMIFREIEEEAKIYEGELYGTKALMFAEGISAGTHRNPNLFSISSCNLERTGVARRHGEAKDAWEYEKIIFVPVYREDPEFLEAYIRSDTRFGGENLDNKYVGKDRIEGLRESRTIQTTAQASLMLFLVGRYLYGDKWYRSMLDECSKDMGVIE